MKRLYFETSVFAIPTVLFSQGFLGLGLAGLLAFLVSYFLIGGRFSATNFDGGLWYRASLMLIIGITLGVLDENSHGYKTLIAILGMFVLIYIYRPVEKNEKLKTNRI